jgi:hypothetical protein
LAAVYQHKFEELFAQFENGVHERKIVWTNLEHGMWHTKMLLLGSWLGGFQVRGCMN